jgi:hypothetical protein
MHLILVFSLVSYSRVVFDEVASRMSWAMILLAIADSMVHILARRNWFPLQGN